MHSNVKPMLGFAPVVVTDNTATSTSWVDRQGYESVEFVIATGTLADSDAVFTIVVQDADASDQADAANVADDYLLGTEASAGFTFAADSATRRVGYCGRKRYVKLTCTPSGNTGNAPLACVCLLSRAHSRPVA
jgi:hypothetical protein